MARLDRELLRRWTAERIQREIGDRDRQIRELIREELEQTEFFNGATMEFDVRALIDRDERLIRELREEIGVLRSVH